MLHPAFVLRLQPLAAEAEARTASGADLRDIVMSWRLRKATAGRQRIRFPRFAGLQIVNSTIFAETIYVPLIHSVDKLREAGP